jgi:hypothetical protein
MRITSTAILGLAGSASLATASPRPLATVDSSIFSAPSGLEKRAGAYWCNDDTWKTFGERAALAGFRLMGSVDDQDFPQQARDDVPDSYSATPGQCHLLWCGGGGEHTVAFYLCLKPDAKKTSFAAKDLARKFHDGFNSCYSREPIDKNVVAKALHIWEPEYTLSLEGGPGLSCPADMQTDRFAYPDSFNKPPYVEG